MIEDPPLPDGAFVNGQLLITSYFDSEGRLKYCIGVQGELNIAQALGLLVLGGITMFRQYEEGAEYGPDEIEEDEDDG